MSIRLGAFALAGICLFGSPLQAATIIDTTAGWDGSASVLSFGETDTATYGQTFTVPLIDSRLDSFTFYVDDFVNPDFVDFGAYVMGWNGVTATGPVLFSSGPMSTNNNGGAGGFQAVTVNTGGLNLTAGTTYVAFLSTSNFFDGVLGTSQWAEPSSTNPYSGGEFVFMNNANNFASLTGGAWERGFLGIGGDLAFNMQFSAPAAQAPEPASLLLLGTGLLGAGARRWRQKRA